MNTPIKTSIHLQVTNECAGKLKVICLSLCSKCEKNKIYTLNLQ